MNENANHSNCCQNPCPECVAKVETAIASPKFAHARAKRFLHCFNDWQVLIYHRNPTSPTGVLLAAGGLDKWVAPLLTKHGRTLPFGPNER